MKREAGKPHRGILLIAVGLTAVCGFVGVAVIAWASAENGGTSGEPDTSLARRLLEAGRIEEARAIYERRVADNPRDAESVKGLAICHRDSGDDEGAIAYWQRYTILEPGDANGFRQLALACHRCGRSAEALAAAQSALSVAGDADSSLAMLVTKLMTELRNPVVGMHRGVVPGQSGDWPRSNPVDASRPRLPDASTNLRSRGLLKK